MRVLGNAADAEDVAQECFIELAQSHAPARLSLGGWLHTMARRRSLDRMKADQRRRSREIRFADEAREDIKAQWNEMQEYVDQAIDELPPKLREPIVHRFLLGETHEAIARGLDIPRSTAQYRVAKGLEAIRKALRRRGVLVTAAALGSMLSANAAHAAPATVTASLGRLAIAVSMHPVSVPADLTAASSTLAGKAAATAVAAMIVATAVAYMATDHETDIAGFDPMPVQKDAQGFSFRPLANSAEALDHTTDPSPRTASSAISGSVLSPFGAPCPRARVLAVQIAPFVLLGTTCDGDGRFHIEGLWPGARCTLVADHDRFEPSDRESYTIPSDHDLIGVQLRLKAR